MLGDGMRFTRQDGVEEQWRIMQPLLDAPPPVHPYEPGSWGPEAGRQARRRARPLARPLGDVMTAVEPDKPSPARRARRRRRRSRRSPSYAFLSDCHTGALVAPDGAIDWLCVPRFDSPSVFGSLLDRQAGLLPCRALRDQPSDRGRVRAGDERPRDDLEDAERVDRRARRADDGPARPRGHDHAPHASAGRRRRRPHARADGRVPRGQRRGRARLRAGVRLRPRAGDLDARRGRPACGRRERRRPDDPAGDGHGSRNRGEPHPGPARAQGRRAGLLRALAGRRTAWLRRTLDEAEARIDATTSLLARLARAAPESRITASATRSSARRSTIKGLTYMPTGATVAALTTSLPETPGGERNWDYRYTWIRDTTFTLQALHYLNLDWEADEFMQFVADVEPTEDGSLQIMYGIDGRRDLTESTRDELTGYAGAQPGSHRQRRLRPAPERRLRRRARLDPAAHATGASGSHGGCGRSCRARRNARSRSGASRTRASGRRAASRSTTSPRS